MECQFPGCLLFWSCTHDQLMYITVQARQRTGRAGREAAGYCYRLYTTEHFEGIISLCVAN